MCIDFKLLKVEVPTIFFGTQGWTIVLLSMDVCLVRELNHHVYFSIFILSALKFS